MNEPQNDGGPIHPLTAVWNPSGQLIRQYSDGMSLRAWLAGQALAAHNWRLMDTDPVILANECVARADALIEALKERAAK